MIVELVLIVGVKCSVAVHWLYLKVDYCDVVVRKLVGALEDVQLKGD